MREMPDPPSPASLKIAIDLFNVCTLPTFDTLSDGNRFYSLSAPKHYEGLQIVLKDVKMKKAAKTTKDSQSKGRGKEGKRTKGKEKNDEKVDDEEEGGKEPRKVGGRRGRPASGASSPMKQHKLLAVRVWRMQR